MNRLPVLSLDSIFLFPKCDNQLSLDNSSYSSYWKKIILRSLKSHGGRLLIIPNKEKISSDLKDYPIIGTLAEINLDTFVENSKLIIDDSMKQIHFRGLERVKVINLKEKDNFLEGEWEILLEKEIDENSLNELTEKFVRHLPEILERTKLSSIEKLPYMTMMRGNISNLIDFITQNSREVDTLNKWKILASLDLWERLEILLSIPDRQRIEKDIEKDTSEEIKNQQEEYYLREKIKAIEKRLKNKKNAGNNEIGKYLERIEKNPYPNYVKKVVQEEIERYESMPSNSNEANIIKQYVDWLVNLPWWKKTEEIKDLAFARQKLDEKHYGLQEIKERIIEYLAARQKSNKPLGQVICLVGPPGVGKTSLATSIAEAIGREFVSISVGGTRDVAEIQGHRRTYIGAMPGRIIQAMKKVGVINPLFLIDELDKISQDFRGDPAYALLEALDPNQNKKFVDNYLGEEIPYNLSEVMFICTANTLDLPLPLLDRMEIIHLSSYTEIEKFQIAKKYLIPESLKRYNLNDKEIIFEDQTITDIIKYYTREAGVRELNRIIQLIIRKFIVQLIKQEKKQLLVTPEELKNYLKKKKYDFTEKQKYPQIGVATGLAYTGYGGDILLIEVAHYPRKEGELELTGNLGDIMKESAHIALNYIKSNHKKFGIDLGMFSQNGIHIHAPEGATPKEGPSAGIALTSAIISALTGQAISQEIGMTGEITLHGHVGEIGGLKEKAIAAHRSQLKTIIIPKSNEKDIEEIPTEIQKELKIILVEEYDEVWEVLFAKKRKNSIISIKPTKSKRQVKQAG